jgi:hypothetical protein
MNVVDIYYLLETKVHKAEDNCYTDWDEDSSKIYIKLHEVFRNGSLMFVTEFWRNMNKW